MSPSASGRDASTDTKRTPSFTRRHALRSLALLAGGATVFRTTTTPTTAVTDSFAPKTWQSDTVPDTPIHQLSFPGTHHAAMVDTDPDSPEYYDCQTRDVYTQLSDGIRFFDVRVQSHGNGEDTHFTGHHGSKTGRSLDDEVFPQIQQYLAEVDSSGATELVLLKLSHFHDAGIFSDDAFEPDDWQALSDLLQSHFGEYALDLGAMASPDELLDATLSAFDGPRIAVFHRTLQSHDAPLDLPPFTDAFADWVDSFYPDTPTPGNVLAGGVTNEHTDTSRLGETQWIVRAPTDLYSGGQRTNDMLSLFGDVVRTDAAINPNLVRVDFYETSTVVALCRALSQGAIHGTIADAPTLSDGRYSLQSVETGNTLEIEDGDTSDGASAVEAAWTDSAHERFDVTRNDDGTYRLTAAHSGKVLTVAGGGTDDAADVVQQPWTGTAQQRWYAIALEDDRYCFVNAHSGRILDGENPGQNVHQWHWEDDPNQKWTLVSR